MAGFLKGGIVNLDSPGGVIPSAAALIAGMKGKDIFLHTPKALLNIEVNAKEFDAAMVDLTKRMDEIGLWKRIHPEINVPLIKAWKPVTLIDS